MSAQTLQLPITDRSRVARDSLNQLLSQARSKATGGQLTIQSGDLEDLLDKFNLWAGSLGALQAPSRKLSLDHRLQEAPDVRDQICEYLENLQEAIQDLNDIITGDNPNRSIREESNADGELEYAEDSPEDEAQMILEVLNQCMRSLFRIAVLVRQASPQDRFKRALQHTELAFPDSFDIEHVEQKHPKLRQGQSKWLARRLGGAIAKRRQFIRYCRDHKFRLGFDDTDEGDARTERLSSKATTFLKSKYMDAEFLQSNADDSLSLSTATTAFDSETLLKLPRLTELSPDGQAFECPICFTLQVFPQEKAWKIHAFRDLKPYVCTFNDENCNSELFEDRHSWFEHELRHHRSQYTCSLCKDWQATSKSDTTSHIASVHGSFSEDQVSMLLDAGRQVPADLSAKDCPFCDDWAEALSRLQGSVLVTLTRFKRHVATHQEQLAIFAIPRSSEKTESIEFESTTRSISVNMSVGVFDNENDQREPEDQDQAPAHHSNENFDDLEVNIADMREELNFLRNAAFHHEKSPNDHAEEAGASKGKGIAKEKEEEAHYDHKVEDFDEHVRQRAEEEVADHREEELRYRLLEQVRKIISEESNEILKSLALTERKLKYENMEKERSQERPTYTRLARKYLSLETLRVYNIDYQIDQDPDYVLVKRWVPEAEQDVLWRHTRILREQRTNNVTRTADDKPRIDETTESEYE